MHRPSDDPPTGVACLLRHFAAVATRRKRYCDDPRPLVRALADPDFRVLTGSNFQSFVTHSGQIYQKSCCKTRLKTGFYNNIGEKSPER